MTEPQEPRGSSPWLTTLQIILAVIIIGAGVCVFVAVGG